MGLAILVAEGVEPFVLMRVVRYVDDLQATTREGRKILDERLDADSRFGTVHRGAVGSLGLELGFAVYPARRRFERALFERAGRVERGLIVLGADQPVGVGVLRAVPLAHFLGMAGGTGSDAGVRHGRALAERFVDDRDHGLVTDGRRVGGGVGWVRGGFGRRSTTRPK